MWLAVRTILVCSANGGSGKSRVKTLLRSIPGITPCPFALIMSKLACRNNMTYCIFSQACFCIAIICLAICASSTSQMTVFPYPDPLQTRSTSPRFAITLGVCVHRFSNTPLAERLLAPVMYGTPQFVSLYSSGLKSVPDKSVITCPKRTHSHDSGISNGITSSIHRSIPSNFS